ncbi:protein AMBP [Brachionichthys hirsutus]|uniref:protein AMBP n=1 Tax=Brachionichthys hirsutus TaxID=412623 RepID=UPI0036052B36
MQSAGMVSTLVVGLACILQTVTVEPAPLLLPQENFDLSRFMGKWYEAMVVSTCPYYMQRKRRDPVILELDLQHVASEGNFTLTSSTFWNGTCKQTSTKHDLTDTPGRFFHHVARFGADVDSFVVHSNYDEYAMMVLIGTERPLGIKTTTFKLYSRTLNVTAAVLDDFKTLVRQHGTSDSAIIINKIKGECVPGEQVEDPVVLLKPPRMRRDVEASGPVEDLEGSGDDSTLFNATEACKAAPDTGPCFGTHQRYFYNSTSMGCEIFNFGGCLGNQNNFLHEKECLQRCRTEAACRLPMVPQICTGQPPVWAFDASAGLCVAYKVNFCQDNANKFYSKAECEEYCGVLKDDPEILNVN